MDQIKESSSHLSDQEKNELLEEMLAKMDNVHNLLE